MLPRIKTGFGDAYVASAFIKAKDKVLPSLQRVVEIGAPVEVDGEREQDIQGSRDALSARGLRDLVWVN